MRVIVFLGIVQVFAIVIYALAAFVYMDLYWYSNIATWDSSTRFILGIATIVACGFAAGAAHDYKD